MPHTPFSPETHSPKVQQIQKQPFLKHKRFSQFENQQHIT